MLVYLYNEIFDSEIMNIIINESYLYRSNSFVIQIKHTIIDGIFYRGFRYI